MSTIGSGIAHSYGSGEYCTAELHVYPKTYAGDPQYAAQYFSRCLCGKKRKVTTVTEVDAGTTDE
jgi:hypothetical protein